MAVRFFGDGDYLLKKRREQSSNNDDGDIEIQQSVELARQASELSRISQQYADDTALEIAAKLSIVSQISTTTANQSNDTISTSTELSRLASQANTITQQIATYADSIISLSQAIADWPLYTNDVYDYSQRFRDLSFNNIELTVSGTENSNYTVKSGYGFFDVSPHVSGLHSNVGTGPNVTPFLVNLNDSDINGLILTNTEPFSIEFLYKYESGIADGYIINFGNQFQIKVYDDPNDIMTATVGGSETINSIDLSDIEFDWAHFAFAYDPLQNSISAFKNGEFVFIDTNISSPGTVPEDNKIRILEGLLGAINNLRIYKATLSNSTIRNIYNSYKSRYNEFLDSSIYAQRSIGGNKTKIYNASTGTLNALNTVRNIFSKNYVDVTAIGSKTPLIVTDTNNYNAGGSPPYTYFILEDYFYNLIDTQFVKLPQENYLVLHGQWITSNGTSAYGKTSHFLLNIKPAIDPGTTFSTIQTSGLYTREATNSGIFTMSADISSLDDGILYNVELRGRLQTSEIYNGILKNYSFSTMTEFPYNIIGPGNGQLPLPS